MTEHSRHAPPASANRSPANEIAKYEESPVEDDDGTLTGPANAFPITDDARAASLRLAERDLRSARRHILDAQLPPRQWESIRLDVERIKQAETTCNDFAESWEFREYDERRRTA